MCPVYAMPTRPSPRSERLGTPNNPAIRFTRGPFFEASLVRVCYGLSGCSPPWTDLTEFPRPPGAFTSRLPTARSPFPSLDMTTTDWTPLLAGLSPAGMAASLAAPDRNGVAPARKQQGQEAAATRTVYPAPYGTSAPTPAKVAPSVPSQTAAFTSSGQPSLLVTEQAGAEHQAAPRTASAIPASPLPSTSSGQPITTELVTRDAPETRRMASTTPEASAPKLVDINTASVDELNSLGGRFGRVVVAGRPYASIDELVSKRVLTRSTFSQIKDQITAN